MKKNKKYTYAFGGSLGEDLQQLAPLASLIPGVGTIAGPALNLIGGLFGDKRAKDPRNPLTSSPGNYYLGGPVMPQESTAVAPRPLQSLGAIPTNSLDQLTLLNRAQANKFLQNFDPTARPNVQARPASMRDRYIERANGGFVNLSSTAYEVEGDPSVTDSVNTDYKGMNLKLDHDEVVDTAANFVYSNKIINPLSKQSFAKDAARLEMRKGKAEKAADRYGDTHAANTIKHIQPQLNTLANAQELIATLKGKRPSPKGMDQGGPINPWLPFLYSRNQGASNAMMSTEPNWTYSLLDQMPPLAGQEQTLPQVTVTAQAPSRSSRSRRTLNSPVPVVPPTQQQPTQVEPSTFDIIDQRDVAPLSYPNTHGQLQPLSRELGVPYNATQTQNYGSSASTNTVNNDPRIDRGFTAGDALQVGSLINSFARLRGGPEVEQANYDTSKITRNVYDVNPTLQSNAANFNQTANNIDTSSATLRRALQNQMMSSKMRADNSALAQYDQMNQGARTDYESRVSNQNRYNVGQRTYTNDINARNKGAYDSAVQNAFGNLSNFGIGLNQRKQAYDALDLYGSTYKDVYSRILKTLGQNG